MRACVFLLTALLTGCQSLTGLPGATTRFACKAPDGISCTSVSGVYANLAAGTLPFQMRHGQIEAATAATGSLRTAAPEEGAPVRVEAQVLRIWLAPWIDDADTLHDQAFLYAAIGGGRWSLGERQGSSPPRLQPQLPVKARARSDTATAAGDNVGTARQRLANVRGDAVAQSSARAAAQRTTTRGGDK